MHRTRVQTVFFFAFLVAVLALAFFIFLPYLTTLSVAATFAVVTHPLHKRLTRLLRQRERLSAFLIILMTVLVVLIPLSFIGTQVVLESQSVYQRVMENQTSLMQYAGQLIERFAPDLSQDLSGYAGQALSWIAGKIGPIFAGTAQTFLHFLLGIIAYYYFLKDGRRFLTTIVALSPLPDQDDAKILGRLETAVNTIIRGTLTIALIQGVLTGIGLWIFGVPSPTLWGSIAAAGALVPGIGTAMVVVPAALYLFLTRQTVAAIGLLIWGTVAVGLIDNLLGPFLVGRGVRIHPFIILFAVIGGIGFFGPVGFLLGPLVISLLFALLDIYRLLMIDNAAVGPAKQKEVSSQS
ncbi:MAG: AI-2E family transporter [Candidatus Peribacteraceae bacterium]|nr:AI-2E family transporter [Candidatus Peribacteraceae bacterium]